MTQLVAMLLLALIGLWWWGSMQAREVAVGAARRACRTFSTQLLDDSVVLRRIRLQRDRRGRVGLLRMYTFEFTRAGDERRNGYVSVIGRRVLDVHLDDVEADAPPPPGRTLH